MRSVIVNANHLGSEDSKIIRYTQKNILLLLYKNSFQHDLNEMTAEAQVSEEKAQRAMIDAARLADELRVEQEASMLLERDRRLLEAQV